MSATFRRLEGKFCWVTNSFKNRYFVADHRFVRRTLGTTYVAGNPALEGVYFLLNQLPPELRLTEISARYAWKLDVVFYFDVWRRALCGDIWERRWTHPVALAFSSCCRQLEACRQLRIPWPDSTVVSAADHNTVVSEAVRQAEFEAVALRPSLWLLTMVRPSRDFRRRFFLDTSRDDGPSGFLAACLLDDLRLVPAIRARWNPTIPPGFCDVCGGRHPGNSLVEFLLVCPALDGPRADWCRSASAVAAAHGVQSWWAAVMALPPSPFKLASAVFGLGASSSWRFSLTALQFDLALAFAVAFASWLDANPAFVAAVAGPPPDDGSVGGFAASVVDGAG